MLVLEELPQNGIVVSFLHIRSEDEGTYDLDDSYETSRFTEHWEEVGSLSDGGLLCETFSEDQAECGVGRKIERADTGLAELDSKVLFFFFEQRFSEIAVMKFQFHLVDLNFLVHTRTVFVVEVVDLWISINWSLFERILIEAFSEEYYL